MQVIFDQFFLKDVTFTAQSPVSSLNSWNFTERMKHQTIPLFCVALPNAALLLSYHTLPLVSLFELLSDPFNTLTFSTHDFIFSYVS